MNKRLIELAEQSGFMLWQDESWNPGDVIDWGARYDKEFHQYSQSLINECCEVIFCHTHVQGWELAKLVKEHFGIKE